MRPQEVLNYKDPQLLLNATRTFAIFDKAQIDVVSNYALMNNLQTGYGDEDPAVARHDQPFANQPVSKWRYGTAFLIAKNLLVTAHHVLSAIEINDKPDIKEARFVRNYIKKRPIQDENCYSFQDVHEPTAVIQEMVEQDWAAIALKPCGGLLPSPVEISDTVPKVNDPIYCLGHPTGLPMKVTYGKIKMINGLVAQARIDTYSGNSGSPVFCANTHKLIGMLTAGANDYSEEKTVITVIDNHEGGETIRLISKELRTRVITT
jgi:V8-like Glu-specific endopeptidase